MTKIIGIPPMNKKVLLQIIKEYIDKFITGLAQDINTPCEPISG